MTATSPRWYYEVSDVEWADLLVRVQARPRGARLILRGATVVSLDPQVGDHDVADISVVGSTIEAVGLNLAQAADPDAVLVDARGMIVMPGMVDGHRHCWQSQFRGVIPDASTGEYMATVHDGFAKAYQPEDMYAGVLTAALGMLDAGITTVLDLSHNSRSTAHSDAVFAAYAESGSRAVHASVGPSAGEWDEQWPADLERLRDTYHGRDGRTSVRLGLTEIRPWTIQELVAYARRLGLAVSFDGVAGAFCREVEVLGDAGLLGPDITLIHGSGMTAKAWRHVAASGTRVTTALLGDQQTGVADGLGGLQDALDHAVRPSLSCDVEVVAATDMFTQMRHALSTQRSRQAHRAFHGEIGRPAFISSRDVLEMCVVQGAQDVGLGDVVGSLTPGKEADLVLIAAQEIGNLPHNHAVGTIVHGTDRGSVRHVLVAGIPRKWHGRLVDHDVDRVRRLATESRDRVAAKAGFSYTPAHPHMPVETAELAAFADELRRRPEGYR